MLQQRKVSQQHHQQQHHQQQHWDSAKIQLQYEDTSPSKFPRKKKTNYGDILLGTVNQRGNKTILFILLTIITFWGLYDFLHHNINKDTIRIPTVLSNNNNNNNNNPTDCGSPRLLKKSNKTNNKYHENEKTTTTNYYKPRVFGYYFNPNTTTTMSTMSHDTNGGRQWRTKKPKRLPVYDDERYPSKRRVMPMLDKEKEEYIQNSQHYTNNKQWNKLQPYKDHPECQPMHDWQESSTATIISNCNTIHETDMMDFERKRNEQYRQLRLINEGYFRNVWRIRDVDGMSSLILKTLRLKRSNNEWTYERHRIDARMMERMTSSPHIMNIYGYCGHASINEFGPEGDIEDWLWKNPDRSSRPNLLERLRIAVQVTQGITDLHTYDSRNGHSAMVHADIMTNQFVYTKSGRFKLNDFNRAHFMYWNTTSDENTTCPYIYPDYNAWTVRFLFSSIIQFMIFPSFFFHHNNDPHHHFFLTFVCVCW